MFEFLKSLFNPSPPSGATAKERLRLVLLSDHLSLAPDVIEAMKRDLLEVFSRYVEIDVAHADVTFEQREAEVAMLASVPITGVRERKAAVAPEPPPAPAPAPQPEPAQPLAAVKPDEVTVPMHEPVDAPIPVALAESQTPVAAEPSATDDARPVGAVGQAGANEPLPARSANGRPPRRRRRKKPAPQNGQQAQPKLAPPGIAASQA